jgi:hypothetical protein
MYCTGISNTAALITVHGSSEHVYKVHQNLRFPRTAVLNVSLLNILLILEYFLPFYERDLAKNL